jgi:hypothetical protein
MLNQLPCTTLDGESVKISLFDICYIDIYRPNRNKYYIRFHTLERQYIFRLVGALDTCEDWFGDFGFTQLDTTNVVNINKIKYVDDNLKLAWFDNTRYVTISNRNMYKVRLIPRKP